eukprot:scaffold13540_cov113-Isochrysis_galbana.AAC.2
MSSWLRGEVKGEASTSGKLSFETALQSGGGSGRLSYSLSRSVEDRRSSLVTDRSASLSTRLVCRLYLDAHPLTPQLGRQRILAHLNFERAAALHQHRLGVTQEQWVRHRAARTMRGAHRLPILIAQRHAHGQVVKALLWPLS